jgi:hypothetical protein
MGESHKHIWNVFVDLDRRTVIGITEERAWKDNERDLGTEFRIYWNEYVHAWYS